MGLEPGPLDRFARRTHRKLRSVFARSGFPALLDAGARRDPLIRSVNDLLQIGIRQNAFRIRMASTKNACVDFRHPTTSASQKTPFRKQDLSCPQVAGSTTSKRRGFKFV